VFKALFDADSGIHGIFEGIEAEAEGGVVVKHLIEELSALFYLQVVAPVESSLVDCASEVTLLWLSLCTADENVEGEHIVDCELLLVNPLFKGFLVDDDFVAINEMFFDLVGKNAF